MIVSSTRLGELSVVEDSVINFAGGFLGFPEWQQGVLVPVEGVPEFLWLQFTHDPAAAFLLLDVKVFASDYDCQAARAAAELATEADVYTIVTVPDSDLSRATTNLLAPVVISPRYDLPHEHATNDKRQATLRHGQQVVLHDSGYSLRFPLFAGGEK